MLQELIDRLALDWNLNEDQKHELKRELVYYALVVQMDSDVRHEAEIVARTIV